MKAHRPIVLPCLVLALLQGPTHAGDVVAAKQFIDIVQPLYCELISLQVRGRGLEPGSPAHRALASEFYKKARETEQKLEAETRRCQAVVQALTPQEKAEVARYGADRDEICVKTACGGSPCATWTPKGDDAAAPRGPTKVEPHSPPGPRIQSAPVQ
jgi:hypothetical protein